MIKTETIYLNEQYRNAVLRILNVSNNLKTDIKNLKEPKPASQILGITKNLSGFSDYLGRVILIPGMAEYAKAKERDEGYNFSSEVAQIQKAISLVIDWTNKKFGNKAYLKKESPVELANADEFCKTLQSVVDAIDG